MQIPTVRLIHPARGSVEVDSNTSPENLAGFKAAGYVPEGEAKPVPEAPKPTPRK